MEINQCVGCTRQFFTKSFPGDDAAVLARSSGEEPASPRHRAGVASMAWRSTRRFGTKFRRTHRKFDFHTAADVDDRPVQELELGNVEVGPVALVPATARGGALAGELAHLNAQRFFAQIAFDDLSTKYLAAPAKL